MIGSIRESGPANQGHVPDEIHLPMVGRFHVSTWFFWLFCYRLKARPIKNNKMADAKKKIGGMKRPLVEAYDSDEEDEQKPKIKGNTLGSIFLIQFTILSQMNYHAGPFGYIG